MHPWFKISLLYEIQMFITLFIKLITTLYARRIHVKTTNLIYKPPTENILLHYTGKNSEIRNANACDAAM